MGWYSSGLSGSDHDSDTAGTESIWAQATRQKQDARRNLRTELPKKGAQGCF